MRIGNCWRAATSRPRPTTTSPIPWGRLCGRPCWAPGRNRAMKWVTWEQVGVDRMACAWLIRRFIDPQATFVFVPSGQTPLPGDAEPFDIPGVRFAHRGGHCTFHTLLREYALTDPVLAHIARIVDEADVVQEVMV